MKMVNSLFLIECLIAMLVIGVCAEIKVNTDGVKKEEAHEKSDPDNQLTECFCGAFKEDADVTNSSPIIEKKLANIKVNHSTEGELKCQKACVSMAEAAKEKAPTVLCGAIPDGHADKLLVKVYSRLCGDNKWTFTGKVSKQPLCCHNGQPIKCGEQGKDAATPAKQK